jgi:hypothetical protein
MTYIARDEISADVVSANSQLIFKQHILSAVHMNLDTPSDNGIPTSQAVYNGLEELDTKINEFISDLNIERDYALLSNPIIDPFFTDQAGDAPEWEIDGFTMDGSGNITITGDGTGFLQGYFRVPSDYIFEKGKYFMVINVTSMDGGQITVKVPGNADWVINSIGIHSKLITCADHNTDTISFEADALGLDDVITVEYVWVHRVHSRLNQYLDYIFSTMEFNDIASEGYVVDQDNLLRDELIALIQANEDGNTANTLALTSKSNVGHGHTTGDISGLSDALQQIIDTIATATKVIEASDGDRIFQLAKAVDVLTPNLSVFIGTNFQAPGTYKFCDEYGGTLTAGEAEYIDIIDPIVIPDGTTPDTIIVTITHSSSNITTTINDATTVSKGIVKFANTEELLNGDPESAVSAKDLKDVKDTIVVPNVEPEVTTTPANFSASRKLPIVIDGVTYYIPISTTDW